MPGPARDGVLVAVACDLLRGPSSPHLILLRLGQVAPAIERFGPGSPEVTSALASADRGVARLLGCLADAGRLEGSALVVVGDHGAYPVHTELAPNTILAAAGLVTTHDGAVSGWRAVSRSNGGSAFVYARDDRAAVRARRALAEEAVRSGAFPRGLGRGDAGDGCRPGGLVRSGGGARLRLRRSRGRPRTARGGVAGQRWLPSPARRDGRGLRGLGPRHPTWDPHSADGPDRRGTDAGAVARRRARRHRGPRARRCAAAGRGDPTSRRPKPKSEVGGRWRASQKRTRHDGSPRDPHASSRAAKTCCWCATPRPTIAFRGVGTASAGTSRRASASAARRVASCARRRDSTSRSLSLRGVVHEAGLLGHDHVLFVFVAEVAHHPGPLAGGSRARLAPGPNAGRAAPRARRDGPALPRTRSARALLLDRDVRRRRSPGLRHREHSRSGRPCLSSTSPSSSIPREARLYDRLRDQVVHRVPGASSGLRDTHAAAPRPHRAARPTASRPARATRVQAGRRRGGRVRALTDRPAAQPCCSVRSVWSTTCWS